MEFAWEVPAETELILGMKPGVFRKKPGQSCSATAPPAPSEPQQPPGFGFFCFLSCKGFIFHLAGEPRVSQEQPLPKKTLAADSRMVLWKGIQARIGACSAFPRDTEGPRGIPGAARAGEAVPARRMSFGAFPSQPIPGFWNGSRGEGSSSTPTRGIQWELLQPPSDAFPCSPTSVSRVFPPSSPG